MKFIEVRWRNNYIYASAMEVQRMGIIKENKKEKLIKSSKSNFH